MTEQQIIEKLKEILTGIDAEKYGDLSGCTPETELRTGLGLNSVGMLYLVIIIEDTFGVRFDTEMVNDFNTVGDIIKFIQGKQS